MVDAGFGVGLGVGVATGLDVGVGAAVVGTGPVDAAVVGVGAVVVGTIVESEGDVGVGEGNEAPIGEEPMVPSCVPVGRITGVSVATGAVPVAVCADAVGESADGAVGAGNGWVINFS